MKWVQTLLVFVYLGLMVVPTVAEGGYSGAFAGVPMAAVGGLLLAFIWGSSIGRFFANPIVSLFDGGSQEVEPHPSYDIGQALTQRGLYQEAAAEFEKQLARLYAEHFHPISLAVDQLEQLVAQPGQPVKKVISWLNMMADFYTRQAGDLVKARETLQRIIDRDPNSAPAEAARQRIAHLALELRAQKTNPAVKLGSYEQNIGLKHGQPKPPGET